MKHYKRACEIFANGACLQKTLLWRIQEFMRRNQERNKPERTWYGRGSGQTPPRQSWSWPLVLPPSSRFQEIPFRSDGATLFNQWTVICTLNRVGDISRSNYTHYCISIDTLNVQQGVSIKSWPSSRILEWTKISECFWKCIFLLWAFFLVLFSFCVKKYEKWASWVGKCFFLNRLYREFYADLKNANFP